MRSWLCLVMLFSNAIVMQDGAGQTTKRVLKCSTGKFIADFRFRFNTKRIAIGCRNLESCGDDSKCSWASSCKRSRLNKYTRSGKLFVAGVMLSSNQMDLKFLCCQAFTYEFTSCLSKAIRFNKYLHLTLRTLVGQYDKTSDKIITNIEIWSVSPFRSDQPLAIVEICTYEVDPNGYCPIGRPRETEMELEKLAEQSQNQLGRGNGQPSFQNQPNFQHLENAQLAEQIGVSDLKWMAAGGVAGGVAGGTVGIVISLALYPCDQFEIEDATVVYSPDQDPVPALGTAIITCDDENQVVIGPDLFTCIGRGEWDEDEQEPYCKDSCLKLKVTPDSATIAYSDEVKGRIPDGNTAEITCDGQLIGKYTCNGIEWEESCTEATCWKYYDEMNGYYQVFDETTVDTFDNSIQFCQSNCAQLVTVHTTGEQDHIWDLFMDHGFIDAGSTTEPCGNLAEPVCVNGLWVGLIREAGSGPRLGGALMTWIDGTTLDEAYPIDGIDWLEGSPACSSCPDDPPCLCQGCVSIGYHSTDPTANKHWNAGYCDKPTENMAENDRVPACVFYVDEEL